MRKLRAFKLAVVFLQIARKINKYNEITLTQGKRLKLRILKPAAMPSLNLPTHILSGLRKK